MSQTRKIVFLSLLVALATILHSVEAMIPNPAPWFKLGLANIISLVAIVLYGVKEGLIVTFMRVIVGAFLLGTFLGPTFLLSFSGGMTSTLLMGIFYKKFHQYFSLIGISVIGAYTHTLTQLIIVYLVIIKRIEILFLAPLFLIFAIGAGIFNGFIVATLTPRILDRGYYL